VVYDGIRAYSITELVPELANRTIMVNGVAKSYAMTGWRLGWMIAPEMPRRPQATCSLT